MKTDIKCMQVLAQVQVSKPPTVQRHRARGTIALFPVYEMRCRCVVSVLRLFVRRLSSSAFLPEIEVGVKSLKLFLSTVSVVWWGANPSHVRLHSFLRQGIRTGDGGIRSACFVGEIKLLLTHITVQNEIYGAWILAGRKILATSFTHFLQYGMVR